VQAQEGQYAAVLQESIAGMRVVQAFAAEEREFENFQRANWAVREKSLEANKIAAVRQPLINLCMQALLAAR
jgi:ABC-type multidrug transport system fused ATPase/permease subunit